MPGQPGKLQASFVSGELADTLEARKDLKYYRSGLRQAINCIPLPQGPATLRPYTRQVSRARRMMEAVSLASATVSAPSGGTAAHAVDGDPATRVVTGDLSGAGPHVVLLVEFAAPAEVSAVDVAPFRCAVAGRISVEYWDGAAWQILNADRALRTVDRSRRFCAPPAAPVTAALWRVVARDLAATGTVELAGVAFWREGASYGVSRLRSFGYSREEAYDLELTGGHGDVYKAGAGWVAGFALPHSAEELAHSRWRQQLNTALLFCATRRTTRIFRENADLEWEVSPAPFEDVPDHDFGDRDYTNGLPAVWDFQFVNVTTGVFTITVDGEETAAIGPVSNPALNPATTMPLMVEALEALPTIKPGLTAVSITSPMRVRLTFSGAGNEGQVIVNATRVLNAADAAVSWQLIQKGKKGGEPIFSDLRGWPRCGAFYQQRLLVGGAPGVPNAFVASVTGEYFSLQTEITRANGAFVAPMDTEGAEVIEEMLPARALLIFTSEGEYWLSNPTLTKEQAPAPVKASSHGIAPAVPVVENEGGAIFVSATGATLLKFGWNEVDQTYATERLSVLAVHLVKDVIDLARKRATADTDANLLWYVQADGAVRIVTLLREQDVTGFARVETDGRALAVCANAANEVTLLFEREVAGAPVRFIERAESGLLLDQAVTIEFVTPSATVTGLNDHEDVEVWAIGDDEVYGPFRVAGGMVTLPVPVSTVTVGRWRPFLAETLPPSREVGPQIVTESAVGFHTVRLLLQGTTSVAVGANGEEVVDVPLLDFGGVPDVPSLLAPFTGRRVMDGFPGAVDDPTVVVTQLRPGFITLKSITPEGDF
ncbi:hypothetical protein V5F49_11285 [Xanthobacter sp. V3C-3]|uniref:hypothetical protein n=1 Tax=Xanthobacter lutulentifluminis TaxID=3119935 RepID=UPI0037295D3F